MNLYYMLQKDSPDVMAAQGAEAAVRRIDGEQWRGVLLPHKSSLRVAHVRRFYSMRAQPDTCGWRVVVPEGMKFTAEFCEAGTGKRLSAWWQSGTGRAEVVRLVWPRVAATDYDLVLSARGGGPKACVFLGSHRMLSRDWLYEAARGTGVEIGPGPVPQILPGAGTSVTYVEQMHPEEWNRLYNTKGTYPVRPELWANYVVGEADSLPAGDHSLDFIFGSHVFEHLTNPYGHLERWRRKLKPGGKVLCIIPDLMSTKDAFQTPSHHPEWWSEYTGECWQPTLQHYARYFREPEDSPKVLQAIAEKFSIHAHFYTNTNTQELLDYACRNLGYSSYDIEWTANHKDLHFMLRADEGG